MSKKEIPTFSTKKCPYCSTHLIPSAQVCTYCKKKVGPMNKHGIADKPTNWKAYTACFMTWGGLFFYFWVLGWSDPMLRFFKQLLHYTKIYSVKIAFAIWGVFVATWDRIVEILSHFSNWLTGS